MFECVCGAVGGWVCVWLCMSVYWCVCVCVLNANILELSAKTVIFVHNLVCTLHCTILFRYMSWVCWRKLNNVHNYKINKCTQILWYTNTNPCIYVLNFPFELVYSRSTYWNLIISTIITIIQHHLTIHSIIKCI